MKREQVGKIKKSSVSWWSPVKITSDLLWDSLKDAAKSHASGNLVG